jgi:hypothetical protein
MHDKMFDHVVTSTILADLCNESYYDECPCMLTIPLINTNECPLCNGHGVLIMTDFDVVLQDTYFTKKSLTSISKGSSVVAGKCENVTIDGIEHQFHAPLSTHEQAVNLRIESRNYQMEYKYPELLKESEKITAAEKAYSHLLEKCELLDKLGN